MLEVAPGPGYFAIEMARLDRLRVAGLDISHTFVEIARENARQAGVSVDFQQGNTSNMPFAEGSFDLIICQATIDHYINFCQAHILHLSHEREDFKRDIETYVEFRPTDPDAMLSIMQHMIDQWNLELTWTRQLRAKEVAQQEGLPA